VNDAASGGGSARSIRMAYEFLKTNWKIRDTIFLILEMPSLSRLDLYSKKLNEYVICNLEYMSNNYSDENKRLIDLIILNTCKYFDISESLLIKGTIRNPSRINALGVCSVLLMRMCKLSQREISEILHKDASLINKYVRKFQTLNANFKPDAELLEKIELIRTDALTQFEINK
jgi:hypothetical protein